MQRRISRWLGLVLLAVLGQRAVGQEACYMAVFSSQRPDVNRAKYTHTWATFAKARWSNGSCQLEAFTISWFPSTGAIQPVRLLPEQGTNCDLPTTIRLVQAAAERVSVWGPYQILPELYQRALAQKQRLQSGAVRYKAVDTGWPAARVSNCIHAVSDLAQGEPLLRISSPGWGDVASYYTTLHLLPWIVQPCVVHEWVFAALGLRGYAICRRDLREGNPSRSTALRAIMAVTQARLENRAARVLCACQSAWAR
jgi:hypothetical protein